MRFFLNGRTVDSPQISALDEGLLYGYGVYDTLRVYSGVAFRQEEHVCRLVQSAEKIRVTAPSGAKIHAAILKTIRANNINDAALRIILTAGAKSDWGDATPSLLVMAKPLGLFKSSFKAISVPFHRDVAQAKTLNCLTSVLARKRAAEAGADEAIFRIGRSVLEGTTCNVFSLRGDVLSTPKDGVLEGVTRNVVLELAPSLGLKTIQCPLNYDTLLQSDEAFITSTLKEIIPMHELDGKTLKTGPVTAKFQTAFSDLVKREIANGKNQGIAKKANL
ncbi:aminotransferase class IV [Candidatus Micrarchaeota archaeon]|nr:aminotransferase class IV [Candidatus Micrarchaeota archaeon]